MAAQIPYSIASNAKNFLLGIAADRARYYKDKYRQASVIENQILKIHSQMREVYDAYIPNVHVVDVDIFTDVIARRLVKEAGDNSAIGLAYSNVNSSEYKSLRNVVLSSVSAYHSRLLKAQGDNTDPIAKLNQLSESLFQETRNIDNTIVARNLGIKFSRLVSQTFGSGRAVLASNSPLLGSSNSVFVFFSKSFGALGPAIRTEVYAKIRAHLDNSLRYILAKDIGIGDIVNLGHAALVSGMDTFTNSPAFASVIYGVGSGRSLRVPKSEVRTAAEIFKYESGLLENKIEVKKELFDPSRGYGVLLSLGVTFTNIEDAELNQLRGRTTEARAVRSFAIKKSEAPSPSVLRRLSNTLLKSVLQDSPALGRSSRSIIDYIQDAILGELTGKRTKGEKTLHVYKNNASIKTPVLSPKKLQFNSPKLSGSARKPAPLRDLRGQFYSLANLQRLLDANLVQKIKENMGDGSRKDTLNLRSGRFAESAKVERLSQSREGMITAFYTYMKYPYQTFEPGFRQGTPNSRNPRLLISKSIREIAATQVANRMRAVLV